MNKEERKALKNMVGSYIDGMKPGDEIPENFYEDGRLVDIDFKPGKGTKLQTMTKDEKTLASEMLKQTASARRITPEMLMKMKTKDSRVHAKDHGKIPVDFKEIDRIRYGMLQSTSEYKYLQLLPISEEVSFAELTKILEDASFPHRETVNQEDAMIISFTINHDCGFYVAYVFPKTEKSHIRFFYSCDCV